jgi:hypothetical protein
MSDYNRYLARQAKAATINVPSDTTGVLVDLAFVSVDNINGNTNFVSLIALRSAMGSTRESQDRSIKAARASGMYTLTPCDRYCTSEERAAEYTDVHGDTFHYISRR